MRVKYNADTQIVFQIGDPIEFSCAAYLHNAMYDYANLNAVSLPLKLEKGKLPEFIEAAKLMGINGFDITTPHKSDIIEYLDECDDIIRIFQCVNHVKIVDGKLIGCGLDGVGMGLAIESEIGPVKGLDVIIIGAGAVAGAIAADLCERGAKSIAVVNRTVSKAEFIADTLKEKYGVPATFGPLSDEYLSELAPNAGLVVQCTTLGPMFHGEDFASLGFVEKLPQGCAVADVLYPMTTILDKAAERGLPVIDGTGMMYYQQIPAIEFRFGVKLPLDVIDEAEEALSLAVTMREIRNERKAKAYK